MRLRASVDSALLPSELQVHSLRVREALSEPFTIEAELDCEDPDVDLEKLLGTTLGVLLEDLDEGADPLRFHGIVDEAEHLGTRGGDKQVYRVVARPRLWGLGYRVRSRLFQGKQAPEIVKAVLGEAGLPADAFDLAQVGAGYGPREVCAQYGESDLDFCSRLLEDEGIFYFHKHEARKHVLVVADQATAFKPIDGAATLRFKKWLQADREGVSDLVFSTRVHHDSLTARDWRADNAEKPIEAADEPEGATGLERFDYPGRFTTTGEGGPRVVRALRSHVQRRYVLTGRTQCRRFAPGRKVTIAGATPSFVNQAYLITAVEHDFTDPPGDQAGRYEARFEAIPDGEWRPPRRTPWPVVEGTDSAVVTGPSGEEIHVDAMGRIKVHFYWDRESPVDDTASFWVRTQQQNTTGAMMLPRVGWEMSVGYIHGDPDRPIALEKVYNKETMPPYGLPASIAMSALQSSTSPGGAGTNEVRLDDSNGSMSFFVHASKDFEMDCVNNHDEQITVDSTEDVGLKMTAEVVTDETIVIAGSQSTSVTGARTANTGGSKSETIGATDDWGIGKNLAYTNEGARTEDIGGLQNVLANKVAETFNASLSRTVGGVFAITSATAITEAVAGGKTELVGGAKMYLVKKGVTENISVAKALTCGLLKETTGADIGVEAMGAVAINVGGMINEKITGNFTVESKRVMITAAGGATLKAGGSTLKLSGSKITVDCSSFGGSGGPQLELKGKINYK